jgi:hypothetical protein
LLGHFELYLGIERNGGSRIGLGTRHDGLEIFYFRYDRLAVRRDVGIFRKKRPRIKPDVKIFVGIRGAAGT